MEKVKEEVVERSQRKSTAEASLTSILIDLGSTDSDSDSNSNSLTGDGHKRSRSSDADGQYKLKKRKKADDDDDSSVVLPLGFLDLLPPKKVIPVAEATAKENYALIRVENGNTAAVPAIRKGKQFWKAGDYEGAVTGDWGTPTDNL